MKQNFSTCHANIILNVDYSNHNVYDNLCMILQLTYHDRTAIYEIDIKDSSVCITNH